MSLKLFIFSIVSISLLLYIEPVFPQENDLFINDGIIYTITSEIIEGGDILVMPGMIDSNTSPGEANVIPGQSALVNLDGDPFQSLTTVKAVFIRGKMIPLKNHQMELYEKYR